MVVSFVLIFLFRDFEGKRSNESLGIFFAGADLGDLWSVYDKEVAYVYKCVSV